MNMQIDNVVDFKHKNRDLINQIIRFEIITNDQSNQRMSNIRNLH